MKLATSIGFFDGDPAKYARRVRDLEAAGVDLVWSGEIYGFDLASSLAFLAGQTERVELMSGIFPVYSRTPALIAQTAATIDALSGGRFNLGLGTSGPQVIEGWHGVPFDKPIARTREVVDICRKVWAREPLTYEGKAYTLPLPAGQGTGFGKPLKFMGTPVRQDLPIWIAAIGPKNVELAAEVANGWQPIFFVPDKFRDVWGGALAAGQAKRDPALGPLKIVAGGIVAFGKGAEVAQARDAARGNAGFYVGGMGAREKNFYNDLFCRYGWEAEAKEIQDLFLSGKRAEAMAKVPDAYLDQATLAGDEGWVRERISVYKEVGVSYLDVNPMGEDHLAIIEKVKAWAE
ncbi:MAG: LLM class F420-dependent oxidoreductase [Acidimicrobiia bacterium]|nr:LLM class F420-dependent oxidoreductase [Acidimicrobiia bacterium]